MTGLARRSALLFFALCPLFFALSAEAQTRAFRARLSPMPLDLRMQSTIAGSGSVIATLAGTTLTITGTFKGLRSPATVARVHRAYRGVKGPSFADLKVTSATSGTVSGSLELTPAQVSDLGKSLFYVQLHSEKASDGNLWGWLLPVEEKTK
jgi:hypothetical protein